MNKQKGKRVRHIPQRTCVGCRQINDKRELVRVVRTPEGVQIDRTGKLAGRGAYLHALRSCWIKGLKGALANALKTQLSSQDQALLESFLAELPEESELEETS
ncbi:hypothetical protein ADN00_02705 [Ornatilinea apprima]|uniref:YlxR domain-containing protein n=1 Tax=Ornatilinea apprima TaxID=1134406 RepID=A0A0N8GNZ1_9CHLR|nr:YlxR family protein [Ornatilinea apprima]KPL79442.1 hypothetical protein ADN00_02705 [Ornatilinea apprima]